jgi:MoaA/NifB/PqqE/SkfB family radical SAM enzyme
VTAKILPGETSGRRAGWGLRPALSRVALGCRRMIGAEDHADAAPAPAAVIVELRDQAAESVDWGRVTASVPQKAKLIVAGEPLGSPDIEGVLFEADRRGLHVTVVTSGRHLEEAAPVLYGLAVQVIRLDLHGPEDVHNRVTRSERAFEEAARGMLALKPLAFGASRPLLLAVVEITAANHDRLAETVECAFAMGAHKVCVRHGRPGVALEVAALKAEVHKVSRRRALGSVRFVPNLLDEEIDRYYAQGAVIGPRRCFVPWRSVTVGHDGAVRLCDAGVAGAHKDGPLEEIFNSEAAQAVRKGLRKVLASGCERCVRRFADEDQLT